MKNLPLRWQARWHAFRQPIAPEKSALLKARWESLPAELQTPHQLSGRHLTHCGFITGASFCSFHCTHCYLPKNANEVPIPALVDVKAQIEASRRAQGPGGGLQITGGDVADAYWRAGRPDELVEIVRHTVAVGLVPMLMTHGQTLIEQPAFLRRLLIEGGLRQIAVHVDMTQAGRHGFPIGRIKSEADLHPVRESFTALAVAMRRETGLPLELAHNCTVTERNIASIPDLVRWFLAEPERTHIWRNLSFLPEADTGRTVFSQQPVTPQRVWEAICEGVGQSLDGHAYIGGHPDCNQGTTLLMSRRTGRCVPLLPTDEKSKALLVELVTAFGGISTMTTDADPVGTGGSSLLPWRLAGALARSPGLALRAAARVLALVRHGILPGGHLRDLVAGRAHTINIGTHNFMDAAQVAQADRDPVVKARLDACVFKGSILNRATGEWETVPMCAMNQGRWSAIYGERLRDQAGRAISNGTAESVLAEPCTR